MGTDRTFLIACAALIGAGAVLVSVGYWLMPVRVLRHAWRNR